MSKELFIDLVKLLIQIGRGFAICFIGLIMFNWHLTLSNPTSDAIILWQGFGGAVIFVGFTEVVKTWKFDKSPEEKRHDEIVQRLIDLEKAMTQIPYRYDHKDEIN